MTAWQLLTETLEMRDIQNIQTCSWLGAVPLLVLCMWCLTTRHLVTVHTALWGDLSWRNESLCHFCHAIYHEKSWRLFFHLFLFKSLSLSLLIVCMFCHITRNSKDKLPSPLQTFFEIFSWLYLLHLDAQSCQTFYLIDKPLDKYLLWHLWIHVKPGLLLALCCLFFISPFK